MKTRLALLVLGLALALGVGSVAPGLRAEEPKLHKISIQVDQNDPAVMNLALNNVQNITEYYRDRHQDVMVELVAYGPGLNMLRSDKSPVKERIASIVQGAELSSKVVFSACANTKAAMEKAEGHPIEIVAQASIVPSGVVRLSELQEQGYSYIKP